MSGAKLTDAERATKREEAFAAYQKARADADAALAAQARMRQEQIAASEKAQEIDAAVDAAIQVKDERRAELLEWIR